MINILHVYGNQRALMQDLTRNSMYSPSSVKRLTDQTVTIDGAVRIHHKVMRSDSDYAKIIGYEWQMVKFHYSYMGSQELSDRIRAHVRD